MRIIEDLQWHRDVARDAAAAHPALGRLIPRPGEQRTVWLSESASHERADQQLLWVPPYSELNGWDAQPSEISLSQIVTARLRRTGGAPSGEKVECIAAILGRISLLDACNHPVGDMGCDSALLANLQSALFWDQVHWAGTATIGGMTYLDVAAGEAGMGLLFARSPSQCSVRYAQLRVDGWSSAALGCWTLQGSIQQTIERHLAAAETLRDMSAPYLTMDTP
jgi:hypothetical protein